MYHDVSGNDRQVAAAQWDCAFTDIASNAVDNNSASITLAKLQNPVKQSMEAIKSDLQDVYNGLGNYSKVLEKVSETDRSRHPTAKGVQF